MALKRLVLCPSILALVAVVLYPTLPAGAQDRIRIHNGGKTPDSITIDETATPPKITLSPGVTIHGAPGSLRPLGNGEYEILSAGNAYYHVKLRGGVDSLTVIDGPGNSIYWLGVGAESDYVHIQDGPGNDEYTIEGKRGDDVYDIFDDTGDGDDSYYVKGSRGDDQINVSDGPGDDRYRFRASREAKLDFEDADGDADIVKAKGISLAP